MYKKLTNFDIFVNSTKYNIPDTNLGIPRAVMPQISHLDYDEFEEYLKWEGYRVTNKSYTSNSLKVTQKDILLKKVDKNMKRLKNVDDVDRVLWISKDKYILDGQHWFIAVNTLYPSTKIQCKVVNCGIFQLLELARRFPKTTFKPLYENKKGQMKRLNQYITESIYSDKIDLLKIIKGYKTKKEFLSTIQNESKLLDISDYLGVNIDSLYETVHNIDIDWDNVPMLGQQVKILRGINDPLKMGGKTGVFTAITKDGDYRIKFEVGDKELVGSYSPDTVKIVKGIKLNKKQIKQGREQFGKWLKDNGYKPTYH